MKPADRRRAEIVTSAAALFEKNGFYKTNMDSIAAAVGVRKPTLYHYFPRKDDIIYAIHDEFIELLIERQTRRRKAAMPPDHVIREIMTDVLELMDTHRGHVRVFFEQHRELSSEAQAAIEKKRRRYEAMITEVFVEGSRDGIFRKDLDPHLATLALAGMCNWCYKWYRSNGELASREIAFIFWDFLLRGVTPRNGTEETPLLDVATADHS